MSSVIGIHRRDYSQAMAGGKILAFVHAELVLQGFAFVDPDRRRWATSRRLARGDRRRSRWSRL